MKRLQETDLDKKYKKIMAHENSWAHSVAMSVIEQRPISVWEVLIPVFFIMNYAKSRGDRDLFTKNLLFTKKLALKAAHDMIKYHVGRDEALQPIREKTQSLLSSVESGIYSEAILEKQMEEIDLLMEHYGLLLKAEGKDFTDLIVDAYKNEDRYKVFLSQLKEKEKEVGHAAMKTLGDKGDPDTATRIQETMDRVRWVFAELIFKQAL